MDELTSQHQLIDYTGLLLFVLGAITLLNAPIRYLNLGGGIWVGGFLVGFGLLSMGYCRACEFVDRYLG